MIFTSKTSESAEFFDRRSRNAVGLLLMEVSDTMAMTMEVTLEVTLGDNGGDSGGDNGGDIG